MLRVLNVAEKNDAAKSVAAQISKGTSRMRNGYSQYNKIYEFDCDLFGRKCQMIMTSVSGHLLAVEFPQQYKGWKNVSPLELFSAPIYKSCPENYEQIKKTLEKEIRNCDKLIIWTDCDREGENIGFEIIDVCKKVNPNVDVWRAVFSEITAPAIRRALSNLQRPCKLTSDAVDARIELDLRIGAAFTRFQTLRLQRTFPDLAEKLISYGSCQFPTLGFVVERFKQRENFMSEPFWKIVVNHKHSDRMVEFNWERVRLFDHDVCLALYDSIVAEPSASVVSVLTKPKSKWRPVALDTVELEKSASRKLKINAKETMKIAEKLYTQGYISYPRTETNIFPKDFNLAGLIEHQTVDNDWGGFAANILQNRGPNPRNGSKSDQAHPPIHPTKYARSLSGDEKKVYDFIVRHFLACCSDDARGFETTATIEINKERFSTSGLMITERNYLDVYPYEKWSDKEMPIYTQGDSFTPDSIELKESKTEAPKLLTEADLIALMEKHGIGTDATHAEHIETVKEREYVSLNRQNFFLPGPIGLGLVEGYDSMGFAMSKPNLRAALEEDLKAITDGRKTKEEVLRAQIEVYRNVFIEAAQNVLKLDTAISKYLEVQPEQINQEEEIQQQSNYGVPVLECTCKASLLLKTKKDKKGFYIGCRGYPECKTTIWLPSSILEVAVTDESCTTCAPKEVKKLKFKLERSAISLSHPNTYTTCIICDQEFRQMLEIDISSLKRNANSTMSSTYPSTNNSVSSRTASTFPSSTAASSNNFNSTRQANSNPINSYQYQVQNQNRLINNNENAQPQRTNNSNRSNNITSNDDNPIESNLKKRTNNLKSEEKKDQIKVENFSLAKQKFFQWADQTNSTNNNNDGGGDNGGGYGGNRSGGSSSLSNFSRNYNSNNDSPHQRRGATESASSDVLCKCENPGKLLTVLKDGPNKGRKFYKCSANACDFFQWEDEPSVPGSGYKFGSKKKTPPKKRTGDDDCDSTFARKARKCGICQEEGNNSNE